MTTTGDGDAARTDEIYCPFPYRESPHAEQAREHLADWVGRTGLVRRESARQRFQRADFGWFASLVYPTADRRGLEIVADWFGWLFLVDDQLDDGSVGRSLGTVEQAVGQMRAVLNSPDLGGSAADGGESPSAVSALADLWRRTAAHATSRWRGRFVRHLEDCLTTAAVWEAGNRVRGVVPDEVTYIEKRRHTGAIYVCMDLIEIVERLDVPDELYASAEFSATLDAACNVVCWTNDIYSLDKERSLGEVHNFAYLMQHHRGLDRRHALAEASRATSAETTRFLAAEERLLAAHPHHAQVLTPYLAGMRTWIRGNLDWSRRTKRDHSPAAAAPPRPAEYVEPAMMRDER
ncbi:MAG: terpene cyclase [Actinophytocola sp.]|uniref:terpene synthase family protein n=1 Tax=Actinophytocola sp. TaxID=1872138 RepID=UPI0013245B5F|nr:hypothetical protein [Actinophytocola sp.]MPZ82284.1 terpene cyclase [Actinophytocola sp.]